MGDLIIRNVNVWEWVEGTRSGNITSNNWVKILRGLIYSIGSETSPPTDENFKAYSHIDGSGKLLIPGLIDSHIHVLMTGESRYFVDLSDCKSIADLQSAIEYHIKINVELAWIVGFGWDQTLLSRYPNRFDLDSISCDQPVSYCTTSIIYF